MRYGVVPREPTSIVTRSKFRSPRMISNICRLLCPPETSLDPNGFSITIIGRDSLSQLIEHRARARTRTTYLLQFNRFGVYYRFTRRGSIKWTPSTKAEASQPRILLENDDALSLVETPCNFKKYSFHHLTKIDLSKR
jgi:hypothetical protein